MQDEANPRHSHYHPNFSIFAWGSSSSLLPTNNAIVKNKLAHPKTMTTIVRCWLHLRVVVPRSGYFSSDKEDARTDKGPGPQGGGKE